MNTEFTLYFSLWFLALGFIAWVLIPIVERRSGHAAATSLFILGVLFLVLAIPTGFLNTTSVGTFSATFSGVILFWAFLMYLGFSMKRARLETPTETIAEQPEEQKAGALCKPKLILGSFTLTGKNKETWRTYLFPLLVCRPANNVMTQTASAAGGAYYGLYFTTGKAVAEPKIEITCAKGEKGECIATASEKGQIEDVQGPVRVYIKNVIQSTGNTATVVTKMGVALNASGGPSITVTAGPVGITMTFPNASLSAVYAMGTYRWRCEKIEA